MVVLMTAQFDLCDIYSQLAQIATDSIDDYGLDQDPKTSTLPTDASDQSLQWLIQAVLIPSAAASAEGSLALGAPLKRSSRRVPGVAVSCRRGPDQGYP